MSFWNNQPVINNSDKTNKTGIVNKTHKQQQHTLPQNYKFAKLNLNNHLDIITKFLQKNYKYINNNISISYTPQFIKWILSTKYWIIGLLNKYNKLVGMITAIPIHIKIKNTTLNTSFINLLCVHRRYRNYGLAPLLINKMANVMEKNDMLVGSIFTAVKLPFKNFSRCRYYHMPINCEILYESGFLKDKREYKILKPSLIIRKMQDDDVEECYNNLISSKNIFDVELIIDSVKQFKQIFMSETCHTYITLSGDFFSFYSLPYHSNINDITIENANFLYATTNHTSIKNILCVCVDIADKLGYDLFTTLNNQGIDDIAHELNLIRGTGELGYYTYNYNCGDIDLNKNRLILP